VSSSQRPSLRIQAASLIWKVRILFGFLLRNPHSSSRDNKIVDLLINYY
jgi:hypothetical protein